MSLRDDLMATNTVPWIMGNQLVTENRKPFEFYDHRFLLDYLADDHRHKVSKKASQIGETVGELFDDFHLAIHRKMNVIHTLHTSDVIKGFVRPKVNPLVQFNPIIKQYMTVDSEGLKQFKDNFVYFRGANSESQAISISADVLKIDEKDRSDPHVVEMFESRLDFSEYKWIREFSNPSAVGFGVDATYARSDQRHWMVWCHHCNHVSYMDFEQSEDLNHYVNKEAKIFACGKCHKELSDADRTNGDWVAKWPSNDKIHGYWFSQMMAPWFTADEIVDKFENTSIEYFHNFVLGKAYTPSDMIVNRDTILRACAPSSIQRSQVSIGVDQDAGGQYYVCMTPQGIFDHGYVDSWEKIEHLKLMYNAIVVCDPNPYQAMPKQMANKYNDWYLCYFKILDGLSAVQWKEAEQVVYADRTRVIDIRANEISNAKMLYRQRPHELEDVIAHWNNLYRTTEEKEDGRVRSIWVKKDDKQSDYPFAECLIYNTVVVTKRGDIPIGEVKVGDKVLTRVGYKPVIASGLSGTKPVYKVTFSNSSELIGTANHPVYTINRGFIPLAELHETDIMDTCLEKNMSNSTTANILDIQTLQNIITKHTISLLQNQRLLFIGISGNSIMAQSLRVMKFIIKISIQTITTLTTYRLWENQPIYGYTGNTALLMQNIGNEQSVKFIRPKLSPSQRHGNIAKLAERFLTILNNMLISENYISSSVVDVANNTKLPTMERIRAVPELVRPLSIVALSKPENVYNLTVEEQPEYYANGVLVHNCYARIGLSQMLGGESMVIEPSSGYDAKVTNLSSDGNMINVDMSEILEETYADLQ